MVEDEEKGNLQQQHQAANESSHIGEVDAVGIAENENGKPAAPEPTPEPAPEPTPASEQPEHILTRDYNNNEHRPTGRKNKVLIVAIGIFAIVAIVLAVILGITLQQQPDATAKEQDTAASKNINVDDVTNYKTNEPGGFADEFEGEPITEDLVSSLLSQSPTMSPITTAPTLHPSISPVTLTPTTSSPTSASPTTTEPTASSSGTDDLFSGMGEEDDLFSGIGDLFFGDGEEDEDDSLFGNNDADDDECDAGVFELACCWTGFFCI